METSQSRVLSPISVNNGNHSHIPIPKIPSLVKLQQQQQQNGCVKRFGEPNLSSGIGRNSRISVAAQRASFEKLQDSVNYQPSLTKPNNKPQNPLGLNNNGNNDSSFGPSFLRSNANCDERLQSTSTTSLLSSPVKRNSHENPKLNRSNSSASSDARWKNKYEESERIRKSLLQKSEAGKTRKIFFIRQLLFFSFLDSFLFFKDLCFCFFIFRFKS